MDDGDLESILFRKKAKLGMSKPPTILQISTRDHYKWVENIKNTVKNDENGRIWLITNDLYQSGITGVAR